MPESSPFPVTIEKGRCVTSWPLAASAIHGDNRMFLTGSRRSHARNCCRRPVSWPRAAYQSTAFLTPTSVHSGVRRLLRAIKFWRRVTVIWSTFKITQLRVAVLRAHLGEAWVHETWRLQHEKAGDMMWTLCSELKAFYAKAGQLIAMQAFVPQIIREKLSRLQDDMPPMPRGAARQIIEAELQHAKQGTIEDVFKIIELDKTLGVASIAQVHFGVLRNGNIPVAVKVQQPDARLLMASDLGNFGLLAEILQRTDLKFDLVGPVKELSGRLNSEFDFEHEAKSMNTVREMLLGRVHGVRIPKSITPFVTRRLLVMEFLDGTPLSRLDGRVPNKRTLRRFGRKTIKRISDAYGDMILTHGLFHADPHPGNILIMNRQADIGIIDFGQTKQLSERDRLAFAELVDAMARRHGPSVASAMASLGIIVQDVSDTWTHHSNRSRRSERRGIAGGAKAAAMASASTAAMASASTAADGRMNDGCSHTPATSKTAIKARYVKERDGATPEDTSQKINGGESRLSCAEQLAYTMFDTAEVMGVSSNPFSDKSALRSATVKTLPKDLFFLLRTLQIIRGICAATGNSDISIASLWGPVARKALRSR